MHKIKLFWIYSGIFLKFSIWDIQKFIVPWLSQENWLKSRGKQFYSKSAEFNPFSGFIEFDNELRNGFYNISFSHFLIQS